MKYVNLFWAIVWGVCFILAVLAIFWNPAQIFSAIIAGGICAAFIVDYVKERKLK